MSQKNKDIQKILQTEHLLVILLAVYTGRVFTNIYISMWLSKTIPIKL